MSAKYDYDRPERVAGAFTLPARYYADPAVFEQEMEKIHYDMWLHAGREERPRGRVSTSWCASRGPASSCCGTKRASCAPSTTPVATGAPSSARSPRASFRAAFSASTTPGPTVSTAGC